MAHLQYIPGDPRLVDQLVYELKSKGIFDQFRKDCIADVDTRPAYQNLRQRVENSVSSFLSRQVWKPDLNKNQLREKLRKHILDGNYLEQGVERIVDQVVNPKVASVFIPQVEDLVYNYLGITRKKSAPVAETSNGKVTNNDLLPTDLEAVSPGSVKSNDDVNEEMDISENGEEMKMDVDEKLKEVKDEKHKVKADPQDTQLSGISELASNDSGSLDKSTIPLPSEEIKLENIPAPENSPPKAAKVKLELENIRLPLEPNLPTDIPLPEEVPKQESEHYFKPIGIQSDDDESSSDSSLIRNMSPLTPIRNFNNENSCDAQQAFEDDANDSKSDEKKESAEPSSFRFTIEAKTENSSDAVKTEKKESEALSYQFNNQVNINTFNTPMYDDSSNSNHLQIDYESDASKNNTENKIPEPDHNSEDSRKDKKPDEKKSSHRSSHHRDSHKHSSSKDRKSDSKQSSSKDSKSDKKSSKEDHRSSSKSSSHHKDKSSERSDKKDSRDSSKHRSSSSHKSSSSNRDSKSHRSSSSSQRHSSSSKHSDERKSSSSHKDKSDRSSDKNSKDKSSKDSKSSSSSHRSDKDRKSSSSSKTKSDDKDKQKKEKKETDDHYSASGRGSHTRRSTDRDSNDGSSSSKGSHNQPSSKSSEVKKESKGSTSKSDNTSTSGDSASPSDKEVAVNEMKDKVESVSQVRPVVRIENHLEVPISSPPRLPFVPDVTLKKPKFAANMQEARKLMKMRKFLDEEQKRMNQEAALLLEFQANVRPSLSQVYSSIPGPELEFACVTNTPREMIIAESERSEAVTGQGNNQADSLETRNDTISDILTAAQQVENIEVNTIDRQDTETVNHSENTETVREAEDDAEDESEESNKAKVQLENITEAKIGESVDMEIDAVDEKKVKIERTLDNDIGDSKKIISNVASDNTEVISEIKVEVIPHLNSDGPDDDGIEKRLQSLMEDSDNTHTEYFQVTIITEELSESEETDTAIPIIPVEIKEDVCPGESPFKYFAEHEKFTAEIERDTFSKFLKSFINKTSIQKMHVVNCDSYEESIIKEVSQNFGQFEIVNYYKNGRLKLNSAARNIVRNVNVDSEIFLPNVNHERSPVQIFSPVKSECSFELSSDYDAKLEEMVSKTSRKEIMEIILGNVVDGSATEMNEMPTIDYCNESSIESDTENTMKRKYCEVGSSVNNNRQVLTPNKIRKLSGSDQISSTTEESEETSNNNVVTNPIRSKYLGRAKRVGLPRPRRTNLPNSPSSDKSVENYEENGQTTQQPNGKLKAPRNKVQRYDTSDLYKPKLHYLSRRNNIS